MRSPLPPGRSVLALVILGLMVAAGVVHAQTPLPPDEPPMEAADEAGDLPYDVPVGRTLFQGSMLLASGSRIPPIPVTDSPIRPEVIVEGTLGGTEAELLVIGSGGTRPPRSQTVTLDGVEGSYFEMRVPFDGTIALIEVANSFGDTVTIERIGIHEAPLTAGDPIEAPPSASRGVAPVAAGQETGPTPPRVQRMVIFRGDLAVRERQRTREFPLDPGRVTRSIEISWWDFLRDARGRLYIGDEESSRFSDVDVDRDKPAIFTVGEAIPSITVACRRATLHVTKIVVVYEGEPIGGGPPTTPAASGGPTRPRPSDEGGDVTGDVVEGSRPSIVNRGPSHIGRNQTKTFTLSRRLHIDRVEVRWTDRRDDATGYISIDDEPFDLRGPIEVETPGTVNMDIDRQGLRVHLHARENDIDTYWVRIHVRPAAGRDPGPPEPSVTPEPTPAEP